MYGGQTDGAINCHAYVLELDNWVCEHLCSWEYVVRCTRLWVNRLILTHTCTIFVVVPVYSRLISMCHIVFDMHVTRLCYL